MNQVNFNDNVRFKLTDKGNEIIEKYRKNLSNLTKQNIERSVIVKADKNEMEYMQFWSFMNIFGDYLYNGSSPVVENNSLYFD